MTKFNENIMKSQENAPEGHGWLTLHKIIKVHRILWFGNII